MTRNIYWTISGTIKSKQTKNLKKFLNSALAKTSRETGCLNYEFWFGEDEKKIYIFERYADADACLEHFKNIRADLPRFFEYVELDPLVVLGEVSEDVRKILSNMDVSFTTYLEGFNKQEN